MNLIQPRQVRVLGIAPSTRGFGFAVLEGDHFLVDWGVKVVKGDKNARSLSSVANLVALYQPNVIALEDCSAPASRRSSRIQELVEQIVAVASDQNIKVEKYSCIVFRHGGTKHAVAKNLAGRFPEELGFRLPQKRRPWMSEDYRMDMFDAVALAEHSLNSSESRAIQKEKRRLPVENRKPDAEMGGVAGMVRPEISDSK